MCELTSRLSRESVVYISEASDQTRCGRSACQGFVADHHWHRTEREPCNCHDERFFVKHIHWSYRRSRDLSLFAKLPLSLLSALTRALPEQNVQS